MVHRPGFEPGYPAWKAGVLDQSRPSMLLFILLTVNFYFKILSVNRRRIDFFYPNSTLFKSNNHFILVEKTLDF